MPVASRLTGDEAYAAKAAEHLRAWFVAPETRMNPSLLFAGLALGEAKYIDLWRSLSPDLKVEEVARNMPIRQPLLWVK